RRIAISALLLTLFLTPVARASAPYCLALRGNGPSEPAHWGALANMVEKLGLPWAQAGGSSASISMFLLDAIASNPWIRDANAEQKKARAALLIKSIYGIMDYVKRTDNVKEVKDLAGRFGKIQAHLEKKNKEDRNIIDYLDAIIHAGSLIEIKNEIQLVVQISEDLGIGQTPLYKNFLDHLRYTIRHKREEGAAKKFVKFYAAEIKQSLTTFGRFDAESDVNLFFREGLVDFGSFALQYGRIASFLSGRMNSPATQVLFDNFTRACEFRHGGLMWAQSIQDEKGVKRDTALGFGDIACKSALDAALESFFAQKDDWNYKNFARYTIGSSIASFPQTTILTGTSYTKAKEALTAYHRDLDRTASSKFVGFNPADTKFGFWGRPALMRNIEANLKRPFTDALGRRMDFTNDEKSKRFIAIGNGTESWYEALSLSPAEPGLSPILPYKVGGRDVYSAGGWSDLHPVLMLKAAGCQRVVYVTRKGGESMFGQGVANRLAGSDRNWDKLRRKPKELERQNLLLNKLGEESSPDVLWSSLYNVANPDSSFMLSVRTADAVLCTNWDGYSPAKQLNELVTDGYRAPWILNSEEMRQHLGGASIVNFPWAIDPDGVPTWTGCVAPQRK
ncbi:MAG: hypothetical protein ABL958_18985, partial [Bdellovibrionia bacterium]